MKELDVIRQRTCHKAIREDINDGQIRTDDQGFAAYLSLTHSSPIRLYTKDKRPKWIYFVFELEDEVFSQKEVKNYYLGNSLVEPAEFAEQIATINDWIGQFKRQYPEGGRWDRKVIPNEELADEYRDDIFNG